MKKLTFIIFCCLSALSYGQKEIKTVKHTHQECDFIDDSIPDRWIQSISFDITSSKHSIQKGWGYLQDSTVERFMLTVTSKIELEYIDIDWTSPKKGDNYIYTVNAERLDTLSNLLYQIDIRVTEQKTKARINVSSFIGDSIHTQSFQLPSWVINYYSTWINTDIRTLDSISTPKWPILVIDSLVRIESLFIAADSLVNKQWNRDIYNSYPRLYQIGQTKTPKYIRKNSKLIIRRKNYSKWEEKEGCGRQIYEIYY